MSRGMFEFIFRYFLVSYDGNGKDNKADKDSACDDDDDNDDNNDDDNKYDSENDNKNNYNDGEEGEEGDANDVIDDPDGDNHIGNEDYDVEVEEENNKEGVALEINANVWFLLLWLATKQRASPNLSVAALLDISFGQAIF